MPTFHAPDGTSLFEYVWPASGKARGTVALVHGYGEHMGRYGHVAAALNAAGFHARGYDLRGHGQSGGRRGFCMRFSEFIDDQAAFFARAKETPGPWFVVAHSFGGLVTAAWLLDRKPSDVTGVVVSSPYYALKLQVPKVKILAARLMSKIVPTLALPSGLKGEDVSRDPQIIAAYDKDPLNNKNATARWFTETSDWQAALESRASEWTLPTLFLVGAADRVADPAAAERVFQKIGARDKSIRMLQGQFHEVFNEPPADREKTLSELTTWLEERAKDSGRPAGKLQAQGA
jgi:alpha-beta hydrolase superfamily lysophospholipase